MDYLSRKNIFNKVVSSATGLAFLVSSTLTNSGCVDSINGYRIRAQNDDGYKGVAVDPLAKKDEKKDETNDEDKWYQDPLIIGGIVVVGAGIGAGTYFLVKELEGGKKTYPGSTGGSGGGEGPSGPGGK